VLAAYDATDLSTEIYSSDQASDRGPGEREARAPGARRSAARGHLARRPSPRVPERGAVDGVEHLDPAARGRAQTPAWLPTRFNQASPRFSPDGRWIAYESDESGDSEIYVALTEGGGEKRRLSPRWETPPLAPGRKGALLHRPGGFVMALPVTLGSRLEAGAPASLFRVDSGSRTTTRPPMDRGSS